ncbi:hypothetical protein F4804DRAFT_297201 [Jackrogersella minutella]|nr:hypothetical protein F4804DRAFT_297201 [Jackrogersella minutella]
MASDEPKRGPKSGVLPGRFRTFVNDMRRFRIHRRQKKGSNGDGAMAEPTSTSDVPQTLETKPASSHNSLPAAANLAVQVTITFDEPLNYSYTRNYEASPSLQATEALCQGLLRRVDHCCYELITRKDSTAMEYAAASGSDKPLRYEIQVDIIRGWSEIWSSRTFKSYQKQLLSAEAARDVIISTHHIIGLFLRHHDEGFVWKDGPVRDDPSEEQGKFPHRAGRVQPMSCVPRSYFLEKSQSFEVVPGYTIGFSFTSRCQRRKPAEWHTTVDINSGQAAPLNSIGAESLFFEASYALESVLRSERQAFENVHGLCISLDGCKDCRHHDNDGLELQFSVTNNLGPQFPHLERTIHCSSNLSFHSDTQECLTFVNKVEAALAQVRDASDNIINRMNDLEFRITELRGRGWSLDEPLVFIIDPSKSYSHRNVEAILDRIQAGVADMLRGNAISVRMTAHKRGHFILDKTFVAREPFEPTDKKKKTRSSRKSKDKPKEYVLNQLRQRVDRDIAMMCKDTLTADDADEPESTDKGVYVLEQSPTHDADISTSNTSGLDTTDSVSRVPTEQHDESANPNLNSQASPATSLSPSILEDYNIACQGVNPDDPTDGELSVPPSPTRTRPPIPARRSSVATYNTEGARSFPLISKLDDFGDPESSGLDKYHGDQDSQHAISDEPIGDTSPHQPAVLTHHPSTINETEKSEEQEPVTTANPEEPEPAPVYEPSIASSTPSLVYGGGSSPDSSLLITPKTARLSSDADYPKSAIVDSDDEEGKYPESDAEAHQDLVKGNPFPSPTLRHVKPIISSPLRVSQTAQEPSDTKTPENNIEIVSPCSDQEETPQETELAQAHLVSTTETDDSDVFTSKSPVLDTDKTEVVGLGLKEEPSKPTASIEPEVPTSPSQAAAPSTEKEAENELHEADANNFAQSKPDFMFSSPPEVTPNGSEDEARPTPNPVPNPELLSSPSSPSSGYLSPDPSEDLDIDIDMDLPPPRRPLQPRGSFGSAGMLGFHEQMFGSINLRTALMRSRPGSSSDFEDGPKRPSTTS